MTVLNIKIRIAFSIDGQSTDSDPLKPVPNFRRLVQTVARKMPGPEPDRWDRRHERRGGNGRQIKAQACDGSLILHSTYPRTLVIMWYGLRPNLEIRFPRLRPRSPLASNRPLPRPRGSSITHHRAYAVSTRTRTARVQFGITGRGIILCSLQASSWKAPSRARAASTFSVELGDNGRLNGERSRLIH